MPTLNLLQAGQRCIVEKLAGDGSVVQQRLMEMGVFEGAELEVVRFAPLGDPMELRLHGYLLSVRKTDASIVEVKVIV